MEPAEPIDPVVAPAAPRRWRLWPRRWRYRVVFVLAALLMVASSATWIERERIVGNLIDNYLARNGIAASYDLIEISPGRQVIADLVVGDPARPDLTAEQVVIKLSLGLTGPDIDRVIITKARLFASVRDGKISFGALDPLIFTDSDEAAALPAIALELVDARARIASDFGVIGVKLDGAGRLDDGFSGQLAATAPGLGTDDCRAQNATLFGEVTTARGKPRLAGPIRLAGLDCAGVELARADIASEITLGAAFDEASARFAVNTGVLRLDEARIARITGEASAAWSQNVLAIEHDLALGDVAAAPARIARMQAKGTWRSAPPSAPRGREQPTRSEWSGQIAAEGLALDPAIAQGLNEASEAAAGTLLEPLLAQFSARLTSALDGASLTSETIIRQSAEGLRLIIPEARLRARSGEIIAGVSQVNWGLGQAGARGNFLTGGQGLPRLNGRFEEQPSGALSLRLAMADYTAGENRVAIPQFNLQQTPDGGFAFTGRLTASGDLPGGRISALQVPIEGRWSQQRGLALGTRCADLRFAALRLAELDLGAKQLRLCPVGGAAMLRYAQGLEIGAQTAALALSGTMGGSPARIEASRATLRYPGPLAIEGVDVQIGEGSAATRLTLASLTGTLGAEPQGDFAGGAAILGEIPFELTQMAGQWRFDEAGLKIMDASFVLADRTAGQPRFEPLAGTGAQLQLAGDDITANTQLVHPASGADVAAVSLRHNLARAAGRADIVVANLAFTPQLQPEDLSYLTKGVIAFASGTITGRGRVEWAGDAVTSNGRFATDGLDFAAAFGPVRGLKGGIEFTDLLELTTAPDQRIEIASINTGVEVLDGRIAFALSKGEVVEIKDARWPFMEGELVLRPVRLDFGSSEEKRYVFAITGLDAATFVAEMELSNIDATGIFDGTVPIVFDSSGNGRVDNGYLRSRAPGGNVSYVGDLTYADMGLITNYAFRALRSLDYREMGVVLDGSLTGEIISKFEIDGVRQGEGAKRNFITRQLARLPIQFRINVKAESFYELSTVVRSFSDVTMLGNPLDRGLLRLEDGRFVPTVPTVPTVPAVPLAPRGAPDPAPPPMLRPELRPDEISVQPSESDDRS